MLVTDYAIILNSKKFSETSKILTAFTQEHGKISLIAKGARSKNSKFGSSLEPLSFNKISFYLYPNKDLHLLSTSEHNIQFKNIGTSLIHLQIGLSLLETLSYTQENYLKNDDVFHLIIKSLELLNELKPNPFSLFVKFSLELMQILGIGLNFDYDIDLGLSDEVYIDLQNGNLDNKSSLIAFKLLRNNFNKMKFLKINDIIKSTKVEFDKISMDRITNFITNYFEFHLDKKIKINSLELDL